MCVWGLGKGKASPPSPDRLLPFPSLAGLQNPIDTMFHLQPAMFLSLFPLFAVFEGQQLGGGAVTSGHPKFLE